MRVLVNKNGMLEAYCVTEAYNMADVGHINKCNEQLSYDRNQLFLECGSGSDITISVDVTVEEGNELIDALARTDFLDLTKREIEISYGSIEESNGDYGDFVESSDYTNNDEDTADGIQFMLQNEAMRFNLINNKQSGTKIIDITRFGKRKKEE